MNLFFSCVAKDLISAFSVNCGVINLLLFLPKLFIDDVHGISETTASIKSLVYNYPIVNTEVNLGDHVLDSYDLDSALGASVHELRSTFTSTQPS